MARRRIALALAVVLLAGIGCSRKSVEDRAREQAEKVQREMVDVEAVALDQKAPADVVSEVQRNLTKINEYQGEIDGKLDSVTINAIQSFQRTAGLKDDGLINDKTREKLAAAAAKG
jgi:peptidoglycan hydrolase-like protein with peptidoglycan-binding domain